MFRCAYLLRFSDTDRSIAILGEIERIAGRDRRCRAVAEIRYTRGHAHSVTADRYRDGLVEMEAGASQLERYRWTHAAGSPARSRSGSPDRCRRPIDEDLAEDAAIVTRLHAAGLDYRSGASAWHAATAGESRNSGSSEQFVDAAGGRSGRRRRRPHGRAFVHHALAIAHAAPGSTRQQLAPRSGGEPCALRRGRPLRPDRLLIARRAAGRRDDVRGGRDPLPGASLAEAPRPALGRAGGALRPGSRQSWRGSRCLVLDGHWEEADAILQNLPEAGNAYLRREVTWARAAARPSPR